MLAPEPATMSTNQNHPPQPPVTLSGPRQLVTVCSPRTPMTEVTKQKQNKKNLVSFLNCSQPKPVCMRERERERLQWVTEIICLEYSAEHNSNNKIISFSRRENFILQRRNYISEVLWQFPMRFIYVKKKKKSNIESARQEGSSIASQQFVWLFHSKSRTEKRRLPTQWRCIEAWRYSPTILGLGTRWSG
jgi:hypothetical protein